MKTRWLLLCGLSLSVIVRAEIALPREPVPRPNAPLPKVAEPLTPKTPPLQLVITLDDGSRIIGAPLVQKFSIDSSLGRITVDLALIEAMDFARDRSGVTVRFRNGDKLQGMLNLKAIEMTTSFGRIALPVGHITGLSTTQGGAGPRTGLILHYAFDKDDDGEVRNQVADKLHAHLEASQWVADGKHAGAVRIPGGGARVVIPHDRQLDFGREDFSYALWFKADQLGRSQQLFWHSYNPEIQIEPNGKLLAYFAFRFCGTFSSTSTLEPRQWQHVVVTREQGTGTMYVNGRKESTVDAAHCDCSSPDPLLLGTDSGNGESFSGLIDEFAVWRRALSEAEVRALYERGRP